MKKFIALAVALVSFGALADSRHMVTLSGYETARASDPSARSLDLYHSNGGGETTNSVALNYAFALTDTWQIGALYKNYKNDGQAKAENNSNTWGVFAIYNFSHKLTDTNYLGLKYTMGNSKVKDSTGSTTTDDDTNTWGLEFGHRFSLGNLWGMNFNWSPSLELNVAQIDPDQGNKSSTTNFMFNVLKVDVLF